MGIVVRDLYREQSVEYTRAIHLVEFHRYAVELKADRVLFLGQTLEQTEEGWLIETPFAVGQAWLQVHRDAVIDELLVYIDPDPTKIDSRQQWLQMLSDIANFGYRCVGYTGVSIGGVLFEGCHLTLCVSALRPLVVDFLSSLEWYTNQYPTVEIEETLSIHQAFPSDVHHLVGDLDFQRWMHGDHTDELRVHSNRDETNQRVLACLKQSAMDVLDTLQQTIETLHQPSLSLSAWRNQMAKEFVKYSRRLQGILCCQPWIQIDRAVAGNEFELLQQSREAWQIWDLARQIQSPSFSATSHTDPVSQPPTYTIYEWWCFQQLVKVISTLADGEPLWNEKDPKGQRIEQGSTVSWKIGDSILQLRYNMRFSAFWERQPQQPYSVVGEQRPDFVLMYQQRWLVLDAKYRTTRLNVLDAFRSAFSYLESLRLPKFDSRASGCFLLSPKMLLESQQWFQPKFHRDNHFGVLECAPSKSVLALTNCIRESLKL